MRSAKRGDRVSIIETAGGVMSPAPSGSAQADLYRPLRLPALLVGDYHLGGIGSTISAYESLKIRGYDILLHLIFEEDEYQNVKYLSQYFEERGVPTLALPKPPPQNKDPEADMDAMWDYYSSVTSLDMIYRCLETLEAGHANRITNLESMAERANNSIWYPFTQHKGQSAKDIMVIDSAYKNNFDALVKEKGQNEDSLLRAAIDGSASWWTQGLGHGNPDLALAAAYAAGRYGHVMFAGTVHEPALKLSELLLKEHKNPNLAKVFFTDNGSTGMEVAIKMALHASSQRYGWDHTKDNIEVIGLQGSYHGDTIGVMDASEPSVYNDKVEWYRPKGFWFPVPQIHMTETDKWTLTFPKEMKGYVGQEAKTVEQHGIASHISEIFNESRKHSGWLYQKYENYIKDTLKSLLHKGHKFGALLIEPIILGAGGMIFCDPLFQRALIDTIRSNPHLIQKSHPIATKSDQSHHLAEPWSGLPVVFDEVFTGLYRLGHFNTNKLVHAKPDIVVNAKLLTGGLLPLCTTTASHEIFDAFLGPGKPDALLHGHSYTAHAVGCQVSLEALQTMKKMEKESFWNTQFGGSWVLGSPQGSGSTWSAWDKNLVGAIADHQDVQGVVALGTVLAITLKDKDGGGKFLTSTNAQKAKANITAGYTSGAALKFQKELLDIGEKGWSVHSRNLGNVIYFVSSLTVTKRTTDNMLKLILEKL